MVEIESTSVTVVESCDALDCLFNDKKNHCTTESIEVVSKKGCITYQQDKAWLDEQLHKWLYYPVHDSEIDYVPVRKDESVRE